MCENIQKFFVLLICMCIVQISSAQYNSNLNSGKNTAAQYRGAHINKSQRNTNNAFSYDNSVMTDEEIAEYIMTEQQKGRNDKEIIMSLLKKGVSRQQLMQIREQYLHNARSNKAKNIKNKFNETENDFTRTRDKLSITEDLGYFQDSLDIVIPDSVSFDELQREMEQKPKIFGHNIFKDKTLNFEPNMNIATPDDYKLGPGDEVIIDVWGASQSTFIDEISPDGNVNIDILGLVYLSGLTVKEADKYLKEQYSRIYAGISGDNPSAHIKLSLGKVRSIQVRVMGEVENPGTYTVSAFASVFHALYLAGGVNNIGTLRAIKVYRNNKQVVTLDIYDYLLNGKTGDDVRLSDGDVISVDTYNCLVNVEGKVKRPMFYEMKESETVADLLRYSGGFAREAYRGDVRIERMGERERQIFTLNDVQQKNFYVKDGDVMTVDSISDTYENLVEAKGALYRPGKFQYGGNIKSVRDLVNVAGGVKPEAFMNRALLNRRLPDMTMENVSIDLKGIIDGTAPDVELRSNDVLYVPDISEVQDIPVYMIYGEVAFPGKYRFAENTRIEDLILIAGGLKDCASTARVEVVRRMRDSDAVTSNDTIAYTYTFPIDRGLVVENGSSFILQPYDAVYVRRSPSYYEQQNVEIQGEVNFAGTYVLSSKNMRLSDLVKAAGGLTDIAYGKGARLERKLTEEERTRALNTLNTVQRQLDSLSIKNLEVPNVIPVGVELEKALANPGSDADVVLQEGDKLIIPQYSNTVKIDGNVMYPNSVAFKEGKKLKYYIEQAGGYGLNAKKSKTIIIYKNGTVATAKKNSRSLIQPGCEIIVPTKAQRNTLKLAELLSISSTSASLATVVLALINLIRN